MSAPDPFPQPPLEPLDLALLRRVAFGEVEALRLLYDQHVGHVRALALRVLRDRPEAPEVVQEIVQETFLEIWRRAPEYDPRRGSPLAWISTLGRTRAIERLRPRGQESPQESPKESRVGPALPSAAAAASEVQTRARQALLSLPGEQRRALELAYFEGLSSSAIARETGEPLGAVKTQVRLGMAALAAAFPEIFAASTGGGRP